MARLGWLVAVRCALAMPSARIFPDAICCAIRPGNGAMLRSTRPASSSVVIGARPLYGTCSMSMPALVLNNSPARCAPEPLPIEPKVSAPGFAFAIATTSLKLFAEKSFRTSLALRAGDGPSLFYLQKIHDLRGAVLPRNWAGEINLEEK